MTFRMFRFVYQPRLEGLVLRRKLGLALIRFNTATPFFGLMVIRLRRCSPLAGLPRRTSSLPHRLNICGKQDPQISPIEGVP